MLITLFCLEIESISDFHISLRSTIFEGIDTANEVSVPSIRITCSNLILNETNRLRIKVLICADLVQNDDIRRA